MFNNYFGVSSTMFTVNMYVGGLFFIVSYSITLGSSLSTWSLFTWWALQKQIYLSRKYSQTESCSTFIRIIKRVFEILSQIFEII